jgi:hypothetical protein
MPMEAKSSLGKIKPLPNFGEYPSLLKNSFAVSSAPGSEAEYAILVVFRLVFGLSWTAYRIDVYFFNRLTPSTH